MHSSWDEKEIRSDRRWCAPHLILGSPSVSEATGEARREKREGENGDKKKSKGRTEKNPLAPFPHSLKLKKSSTVTEFRLFFGEEILFWENQENFLVLKLSANSFHS